MAYGATSKDSTGIPLSSAIIPGTTTPVVLQGSPLKYIDTNTNPTTPIAVADEIQTAILTGRGFVATTTALATATNGNLTMGMSLFNGSGTAKSIYIFSLKWSAAATISTIKYHITTSDPAYANALTAQKLYVGGTTSSVVTLTSAANGATASVSTPGTQQDMLFISAQGTYELLPAGAGILLPAGAATGVAVFGVVVSAGASWGASMRWIEF